MAEKLLNRNLPVEAQRMRAANLAGNLQRRHRRRAEVPIEHPGATVANNVQRARNGQRGDRQPQASASSSTSPNVSVRLGNTKTSADA
jgi:hypothetical protein